MTYIGLPADLWGLPKFLSNETNGFFLAVKQSQGHSDH